MMIKYGLDIPLDAVSASMRRLTNQIYKLLPNREENIDWQKPLETIMEELAGMDRLLSDQHEVFFSLLCKLEGLYCYADDDDFQLFRRTIFECLSLMNSLRTSICQD